MNRKGYFFILDAFIAATIIVISLVSILNSDVAVEHRSKDFSQADSITEFLLDTKMEDLDNEYVKALIADGNITNPRNTLIKQIDVFYYEYTLCPDKNCENKYSDIMKNLFMNISESLVSQKYGYSYTIKTDLTNYIVYNRSLDTLSSSNFRVFTKRVSYAQINQTTIFMPHIVEFGLWTK